MRKTALVLWSASVVALILASAALVLLGISWAVPPPVNLFSFRGSNETNALALLAVGAVISARRPGNRLGRLLIVGALLSATFGFATEYGIWALTSGRDPQGGSFAAWVVEWIWFPLMGLYYPALAIVFPTGTVLSPRWWIVLAVAAAVTAVGVAPLALHGGDLVRLSYGTPNPFGHPEFDTVLASMEAVARPSSVLVLLAAVVSLVVRYRQGPTEVRLQVKWLALAGAFASVMYALSLTFSIALFEAGLTLSALSAMAAIGVAVLRYRLYDIDILINRALVYGVTTGAIAIAFFAGIVVLQAALRPVTSGSELAVAVSTLVSFALFQPLRRRIQAGVDLRFYRSRYDAARTLDALSVRLRDEVDLDAVRADLLDAVARTLQPAHASVWLRR
jgi:hypothetical protein